MWEHVAKKDESFLNTNFEELTKAGVDILWAIDEAFGNDDIDGYEVETIKRGRKKIKK